MIGWIPHSPAIPNIGKVSCFRHVRGAVNGHRCWCCVTNSRCSWQNMANLKLVDLLAYFFLLGFKMCLFSVGICKSHISEKSCWYRHRQSAIDLLLILWGEPAHYFRCSSQSFHVGPSSPKASSFRETSRWFDLLWSNMFFRTKFLYNCDHLQNFIDFKIRHSGLVSGVFEQKDLDSHFSKKIQPEINQQKLFFTSYPVAMQIPYIKNG